MKSKHCFLFLMFVLVSFQGALGQIRQEFLKHLSENKLKTEYLQYLDNNRTESDSLPYYYAKYHLQFGEDSAFFRALSNCREQFMNDSLAVAYSHYYFLNKHSSVSVRWFENLHKDAFSDGLPLVYHAAHFPDVVAADALPQQLRPNFLRLQKAQRKKPLLAGALSSLVPGSGKLYIGNYRSFLLTFVSLGVMALQTWESYRNLGIQHPLTVINGGFFSLYYAVNIFGSFREAKQKKLRVRNQFLVDATKYYRVGSVDHLF